MTDLSDHPLAHRAVLTVPGAETLFRDVRRTSSQWLEGRFGGTVPLTPGRHRLDKATVLTNHTAGLPGGTGRAIRLQLREERAEAVWRTTITALASRDMAAVSVGLEVFRDNDTVFPDTGAHPAPGRPALVRDLVSALRPEDGSARLTLDAQSVEAGGVETLMDVLCDPERRLPVVVAAQPARPSADGLWSERLDRILQQAAGAASLYLLADLEAVDAFREAIGEHHGIAPGAVRAYLRDVDPGWGKDASRHRFVTAARMCDAEDRTWFGMVRAVQRLSTEAPLPRPLRTVLFPDESTRRRGTDGKGTAAPDVPDAPALLLPPRADEASTLRRENERLRADLDRAREELRQARLDADLSARSTAALEEQRDLAVARAEEDMETALRAMDGEEAAKAEVYVLRERLCEEGRYEETVVKEAAGAPESFRTVWERLDSLDSVLVTADAQRALELDDAQRGHIWAAKAWKGLRALNAYARAAKDGFKGGFYQYCSSQQSGGEWPRKQVALVESETTMNRWGEERIFPVPETVDASGMAEMQSHLKIDSKGSTSPRVYFLDDTKGITGRVIVGYIGAHLTNTRTN
ncbi:hypothetical protein [Streptomyces abyssomicinicus]|uniref:hypothetical protein n=1 Tax=Streptomyces abyssomicinicus TaxID=574929 RepID=UPI0012500205|nr:hypothetical protein [Streptomyces abyssomicinicus]